MLRKCNATSALTTASSAAPSEAFLEAEYHEHARQITACYEAASKELMKVLWNEHDLLGHLRSIKHYLFLDTVRASLLLFLSAFF